MFVVITLYDVISTTGTKNCSAKATKNICCPDISSLGKVYLTVKVHATILPSLSKVLLEVISVLSLLS